MKRLTPDGLLSFAKTLQGESLETLHRHRPFTLAVEDNVIVFRSASGKKRRVYDKGRRAVCQKYSETKSDRPKDYSRNTWDASYLLAIIRRWEAAGRA